VPPPGNPFADDALSGNLIDFEVLDFMPPDEDEGSKNNKSS
jgi:hypothetical protein